VNQAVEDMFVDVIIEDGFLSDPAALLRSMREPSGAAPAETARIVAQALAKLDDSDALVVVQSVLDAATCSLVSLLDQDFKNSGLHACFSYDGQSADTRHQPNFWSAYRSRVEPNGLLSQSRPLQ
jgi:hypothetical protein